MFFPSQLPLYMQLDFLNILPILHVSNKTAYCNRLNAEADMKNQLSVKLNIKVTKL